MANRVLTAHVPVELAEQVDAAAARMDRPRGWIVKQALAEWLAVEAERYQGTLDAMAQVRAGLTVDNDRVMAWLESLGTDKPLPRPRP